MASPGLEAKWFRLHLVLQLGNLQLGPFQTLSKSGIPSHSEQIQDTFPNQAKFTPVATCTNIQHISNKQIEELG